MNYSIKGLKVLALSFCGISVALGTGLSSIAQAELAELAVPDASVPDAAIPDAAIPDASVPDAAIPDAAVPDTAMPELAVPDASVPELAVPDVAVPDLAVPDVAVPELAVPDVAAPDVEAPTPQVGPSILDIASGAGAFNTLVTALEQAELIDALSGKGPLTVFAPIDEAFAALPDGVLDALLQAENKDLLTEVLVYHVVEGGILSSDLSNGEVATLAGDLMVNVSDAGVKVNNSQVLRADIQASNGVIHVIDQVLVPEATATELASRLAAADETAEETTEEAVDSMAPVETADDDLVLEETAPVEPAVAEEVPTLLNTSNQSEEPEFAAPVAAPVRGLW